MTDVIVNASKESALQVSLAQSLSSDLYSYRLLANNVNSSRSIVEVDPQIAPSGAPYSKNLTWRLPRYGLLERCLIESTLTSDGDSGLDGDDPLGLRVFSEISLRAHHKEIATVDHDYLYAVRGTSSKEYGDAIVDVAVLDADFTSGEERKVYTPVPMWF